MVTLATKLKFKITQNQSTLIPMATNYCDVQHHTGSGVKTTTIPADADGKKATVVFISATADIWVDFNGGTAAVPTGDTSTGVGSILNPGSRVLDTSQTVISIAVDIATEISLEFYQ